MKRLFIIFFLASFSLHAQSDEPRERIEQLEARIAYLEQTQLFIKKDVRNLYEQVELQGYLLIFVSFATIGSVAIMSKKKWFTRVSQTAVPRGVLHDSLQKTK